MRSDWENTTLIVMAKNAILGTAKTRIATTEGDAKALEIYNQLLKITSDGISNLPCKIVIYYSDFIEHDDLFSQIANEKKLQSEGSLGDRLIAAAEAEFKNSSRVMIIGTDCPYFNQSHIFESFNVLMAHDVVLGPSYDGGYYLIGTNKFVPELFKNVSWSTEHVLTQTVENANRIGLSVAQLETLFDVDNYSDWKNFILQNKS
jgi:rSAM/selenodomain-associated transferase 1